MSDVLYVDNSILKAVDCSTRALMRYGYGYTSREERADLNAGTATHLVLADWFAGGTKASALATLERYKAWAAENVGSDGPLARLAYDNVYRVLDFWLDQHPLSALPFKVRPDLVEIGFAFPLTDDIMYCGRIDALATAEDGQAWYIVDHKTTGALNNWWVEQWWLDSGLTGYMWGASQHVAEPVVGAFVNGIELSKLPGSLERRCGTHKVPYEECQALHVKSQLLIVTRTPEQIAEWMKTAIHLAGRYRDLLRRFPRLETIHKARMQGMFDGACPRCTFHDWCRQGRSLRLVDSMLTREPWAPFEAVRLSRGGQEHEKRTGN